MRRTIIGLVMVLAMLVQQASAELTRLSDRVYAYVGVKDESPARSFAANAGIVIGDEGVLVIDTLISAKEGERFLADIRKVTGKPIRYVVNTHTHLDHALGNCVFARLGATVVAHEADRASFAKDGAAILKNVGAYGLTADDMAGTTIAVPTVAFTDQMLVDLGGIEVRLVRTAPSHTAGSLIAVVPAERIAFAGDILFTDFHPFLADGDFKGWAATLDMLAALDVDRIVPGHGPLSSKNDVAGMKDYLRIFDANARELVSQCRPAEELVKDLTKRLPKRSMALWMVEYNLKARYLGQK